ncbi:membrane protein insertase YidC [Brooklawnia sp.]|uniref:membrane protein insertase YidC n=1 Tax=Brooklawnia sp. TaxID=2699740 RepID=UPI00311E357F
MGFDPFLFLGIWDDLGKIGSAIMQPLYWAVSGIIVLAHRLWAPIFGTDSGVTWALSIIVLTIVIRSLMMPLYAKQLNSSRAMQALQPKVQALQEKYGSDRERLGQETMKLYKEEGVSPTSSCLPMLIQLPIFWGLYRVLYGAAQGQARGTFFVDNPDLVESLRHATLFNAQLSGTFLPMTNGFGATQVLTLIMIILMTALLFFQQLHMMRRNMPPSAFEGPMGQQQKMMLYLMPAMYIFIGPQIPVGVLVYWIISNLWTFIQQYVIIRNYPTPNTPAYVEWEERMVAKGKDPKEMERQRANKGRKRSSGGTAAGSRTVKGQSGEPTTVNRQQVNRQTVRTDGDQKQVVQRQQVQRSSRAARKKK